MHKFLFNLSSNKSHHNQACNFSIGTGWEFYCKSSAPVAWRLALSNQSKFRCSPMQWWYSGLCACTFCAHCYLCYLAHPSANHNHCTGDFTSPQQSAYVPAWFCLRVASWVKCNYMPPLLLKISITNQDLISHFITCSKSFTNLSSGFPPQNV